MRRVKKAAFLGFFILLVVTLAAALTGYVPLTQKAIAPLMSPRGKERAIPQGEQDNTSEYIIYDQFKGMDKPYQGPLPWEKDAKFRETIEKHDTTVLMAAFKAVLPVPYKSEGENIALAASQLAGTVVPRGQIFSQNQTLGPYTQNRGYRAGPTYVGNRQITTVGGGVCKIATMLYNVVTFSDLKVLMRHHHSMTVPYVPPGQDATVYYGARDFRFLNNTDGPVVIWCQRVGNTMYMALYGVQESPRVTWHHRVEKRMPFWVQQRHNSQLPPGTVEVVAPGRDGYVVKSWVTVETPDGTVTTKTKGTSWYNASPRIIELGPKR